jgi:hypothetical protein
MAAMSEHIYRVVVTREIGAWLADVPKLAGAHTYARTLPALDRAVREVVVMAVDRPAEDMPLLRLAYDYRTGDPEVDVTAAEVRTLRERADQPAPATAPARRSTGSPTPTSASVRSPFTGSVPTSSPRSWPPLPLDW